MPEGRCEEWAAELGVEVELRCADTADGLAAALTGSTRERSGIVLQAGDAAGDPTLADAVAKAEIAVVWADLASAERPPAVAAPDGVIGVVRGRGINGYRWSLRLLAQRLAWPWLRARYGPDEEHLVS